MTNIFIRIDWSNSDDSNVCDMSLTLCALGLIFIIGLFNTSACRTQNVTRETQLVQNVVPTLYRRLYLLGQIFYCFQFLNVGMESK